MKKLKAITFSLPDQLLGLHNNRLLKTETLLAMISGLQGKKNIDVKALRAYYWGNIFPGHGG